VSNTYMSHGNGQNAIEQYLVPIIEECGFTVNHFYLAEYDDSASTRRTRLV
jgi:hypothetical protein